MADVIPKSPSLSAMSTATVTILSSLQLDDVIAVNTKGSDLEVHSLAPAKGCCGGSKTERVLTHKVISMKPYDVEASRVATELTALLANDVLARMEACGTTPVLVDGTPVRKFLVIYNPHSGKNRAGKLFDRSVKPLLDLAGVLYEKCPTLYSKHAIKLGQDYNPALYEGVIFVSGDGTVKEFIEGLTSKSNWYNLICRTPICSISSGTANAFAVGVRTSQPSNAAYAIIKHLVRPVDAILVVPPERDRIILSLCGTGWGVPGDIAAESEVCRKFGTARYCLLKVKRGAVCPKKHTGITTWTTQEQSFVLNFLSKSIQWSAGAGLPSPSMHHRFVEGDHSTVVTIDSAAPLVSGGPGVEMASFHYEHRATRRHSHASSMVDPATVNLDHDIGGASPVPHDTADHAEAKETKSVPGPLHATDVPKPAPVVQTLELPDVVAAATAQVRNLIELTRRPELGTSKEGICCHDCPRCVKVNSFAEARNIQYRYTAGVAAASATFVSPASLFQDMEELPMDPTALPPQWESRQGQFVAVGGVNTAQDSKYSHPSDGFIDFVAARKGGACGMIRLGGLYMCGREFESPLMVHEKAHAAVILPQETGDSHFNVDGEDLVVKKGDAVALFLLPALVPTFGFT